MFGEIHNSAGERLDYTYHPGVGGAETVVVIGHGVTGNKDRPFLVALAEGLAGAGLAALRFSFSGNGRSGGRFVDSCLSKEVEDLGAVLNHLTGRQVCYVGHSMGGAVGVLRASRDARIEKLVSLAGMVETRAFAEREFGTAKPDEGFMWDDPACPLSQAFMSDMARIGSVLERAREIHTPWLLVHGTLDDVVPVQESRDIFAQANEPKQLVEIEGADHVFSGQWTPAMVTTVVDWLRAGETVKEA